MPAAFLFFSAAMPFLYSSSVKGNTSEESSSLIGDNLGHFGFVGISPRPLTSSWCATWLAVTRQGGFGAVGSLEIFLIVCHAFRLFPVRSVDNKGIKGNLMNWIKYFLKEREQRVVVNNEFSDWASVVSGIPQGSVLGPSLFTIFINDIPNDITSKVKFFADDTKLYNSARSSYSFNSGRFESFVTMV